MKTNETKLDTLHLYYKWREWLNLNTTPLFLLTAKQWPLVILSVDLAESPHAYSFFPFRITLQTNASC